MPKRKGGGGDTSNLLPDDPSNSPMISPTTMDALLQAFEAAAQRLDDGEPFWYARDLQQLFEYDQWRRFAEVVDRAKSACEQAGQAVEDHFAGVGKMVTIGSGAQREVDDIALSRYAAYLAAQNADPRKVPGRLRRPTSLRKRGGRSLPTRPRVNSPTGA